MPDIANNVRTRTEIEIGTPLTSSIERARDVDFIKVELEAGEVYTITLEGNDEDDNALEDPILTLRDRRGRVLETNDDASASDQNSLIEFEPSTDGVYFIVASGFGRTTGDYFLEINVESAPEEEEDDYEDEDEEKSLSVAVGGGNRSRAASLAAVLSDGACPLSGSAGVAQGKTRFGDDSGILAG